MKIFVDFDDVIFNAKNFKRDLVRIFIQAGISRQEFEKSYYTFQKRAQAEGKFYDPKKQIRVLKRRNEIDQKCLEKDIDMFMEDLSGYVFPDTYEFLSSFDIKDLFLMSYGHEKFQKTKIKGSGIKKHFRKMFISKLNKIDNVMDQAERYKFSSQEPVILIDDRPEQLERAEDIKRNIVTIRMSRKEGRYSDLICLDKDYEVKNFKEALKVIKNIK